MAIQNITLNFDGMNSSAQVGDIIYYSLANAVTGGFDNANLENTIRLGPITAINGNNIDVQYDDTITTAPIAGSFISFIKNKAVNRSSLVGYYAEVKLVNDSRKKAELFSLASQISESSK
mgnify:FL=1|tara:strand:- start:532 stop:891 length:360 start_codon:yes stop_codon:yes gene_type:complete